MISGRHLQFATMTLWAALLSNSAKWQTTTAQTLSERSTSGWTLVWSDEFDQPNDSRPDPARWKFDVGGGGWGNDELEFYTTRPENSFIRNGNLVIRAENEIFTGHNVTRHYTSARIKTQGLFDQAYGRFEARIKIPTGQGMWPAFWLLGNNSATLGWPACGEIDIMENIGSEPSAIHGSMHGPGYSHEHALTSTYKLPSGAFSDDFHVYAVEWEPKLLRFFVDQHLYAILTPRGLPAGRRWVFDHPFFIVLNLAVGGDWPGPPDSTTVFPEEMLVDYVRVYKRSS